MKDSQLPLGNKAKHEPWLYMYQSCMNFLLLDANTLYGVSEKFWENLSYKWLV